MQYKSKDKAYMQDLKTRVYRLEQRNGNETSQAWEHIRRHIVISDLLDFIRSDNSNPNSVFYNYNPTLTDVPLLIITATEHPKEIEIVNAFIKAAGLTKYYRTSYSKSRSTKIVELESLTSSLKSEVKLINASNVLVFGPHIGKLLTGEEPLLHEISNENMMVTSSLIQVLKSDKRTANGIKNLMWKDFQKLNVKK